MPSGSSLSLSRHTLALDLYFDTYLFAATRIHGRVLYAQRQYRRCALCHDPFASPFRSPYQQVVMVLRRSNSFRAHQTTYARLSPVSTFARIHHSRFPFRSCSSSGLSPSAPVHARSLSSLRPGRIHTARSHRRHGIRALFQTPDATPYSGLFFLQRASPAFCGTCELPDGARRPGSGCQ